MCRRTLVNTIAAILIGAPSYADTRSPLTVAVSCQAMGWAWSVTIAGREVTSRGTGEEPMGTIDLRTGCITEPKKKLVSRSDLARLRDTLRRDQFWGFKPTYPSGAGCLDCLECAVHAAERGRTHTSRLYPDMIRQGVDANDVRDIARLLWIFRTTLRVAGSKMEPPVVDLPE